MALFIKAKDGYEINESNQDEKRIFERFFPVKEEHEFDSRAIMFGVSPSPDLGYFDLAHRYWRASLCVYLSGCVGCFLERGIGFTEPWLFNARHSFELRLKGLVLCSVWLEDVNRDTGRSGVISRIKHLQNHFPKNRHTLLDIYSRYCKKIESVIESWNTEVWGDTPVHDDLLLSSEQEEILKELSELDANSFTFRYPTLGKGSVDIIQSSDWKCDATELYIRTGLPKESGCFFDHIKVVNSLHDLNTALVNISNYLNAVWDYVGDMQELMRDLMSGL